MKAQEQQKLKFFIKYKVEGSKYEKEVITNAEHKVEAKQNVQDLYGPDIKIEFLEVTNTSEL